MFEGDNNQGGFRRPRIRPKVKQLFNAITKRIGPKSTPFSAMLGKRTQYEIDAASMPVKDFETKEDLVELCELEDQICQEELEAYYNDESEPASESTGSGDNDEDQQQPEMKHDDSDDSYYLNLDEMFKYVKSPDIKEIYKRIKSALINKGPEICNEFGYVYQLNLRPPEDRVDDPDFVKFYTVDLKRGQLILAFERDQDDPSKVPRADVIFNIQEEEFVRLYNGNKKTAIEFVLKGILKL